MMTHKELTLYLLVDFDNLNKNTVGSTLSDIISYLISRATTYFQSDDIASCHRVQIRLYGGWYEDQLLTRRAQELTADIPLSPEIYSFRHQDNEYYWHIMIELAVSLISIPSVPFMHTYRKRQTLNGIRVTDPISVGCDPSKCRVQGIKKLVEKNHCPDCGTPANKILWRNEQKLVDVMLATDLMTLAMTPDVLICVVSSDEDFWPALFHVSCNGQRIYHMHGEPGRRLNSLYICHAHSTYLEIPLEQERLP